MLTDTQREIFSEILELNHEVHTEKIEIKRPKLDAKIIELKNSMSEDDFNKFLEMGKAMFAPKKGLTREEFLNGILNKFISNTKFDYVKTVNYSEYQKVGYAFTIDTPSGSNVAFRTTYYGDWTEQIHVSFTTGNDYFYISKGREERIKTKDFELLETMLKELHESKTERYRNYMAGDYMDYNTIRNVMVGVISENRA